MPITIEVTCDKCGNAVDKVTEQEGYDIISKTVFDAIGHLHTLSGQVVCEDCLLAYENDRKDKESAEFQSELDYLNKCFRMDSGCY